ncbi:MAG: hypothetical protein LBE20_05970 [Deltaproteobacteria bacterium]|nr:hypothetical protein [Deltaproteobacteria bacterium]
MPKSKELIQLSELVDRYESLSNLLRQERTRLKNNVFDSNVVIQSIKDMIAVLKQEKESISAKIEECATSVPELS